MFELLFMQRALLVGTLIALIAPTIGVFLIMRRQSLIADTLSHIALAGIAAGLLLGNKPEWMSVIVVILGSLIIEMLRYRFKSYSDVSIAIMMAAALSLALCLMTLSPNGTKTMNQYLFGSIVTVTSNQIIYFIILVIGLLFYFLVTKRALYTMIIHEDAARVVGIPVKFFSFSFSAVVGLFISMTIPMIGMLLVSAVIILPAAIASKLTVRFQLIFVIASIISIICTYLGLISSYKFGTPPGASIALWMVIMMIVTLFYTSLKEFIVKRMENKLL